ncbi:MAG: hypothetical protein WCG04_02480 [Alphaproteobacteria bacterium]
MLHFVRNDPWVKPKGRLQSVSSPPSLRGVYDEAIQVHFATTDNLQRELLP